MGLIRDRLLSGELPTRFVGGDSSAPREFVDDRIERAALAREQLGGAVETGSQLRIHSGPHSRFPLQPRKEVGQACGGSKHEIVSQAVAQLDLGQKSGRDGEIGVGSATRTESDVTEHCAFGSDAGH